MQNHLGFSFTSEHINTALLHINDDSRQLAALDVINYPTTYREDSFFKEDNLLKVSTIIKSFKESFHFKIDSASFAIESNLALIKKVSIPLNSDPKEQNDLILWDLKKSVLSDLNDYIFLNTDYDFKYQDILEKTIVLIKKNVIDKFKLIARHAELKLMNLSINQLATEIAANTFLGPEIKGLCLFIKICKYHIESACLIDGKIYNTMYERIWHKDNRSLDEFILEKIITYRNQMLNMTGQKFPVLDSIQKIYLYGNNFNSKLIDLAEKNLSQSPEILDLSRYIDMNDEFRDKVSEFNFPDFVEPIGIAIDF